MFRNGEETGGILFDDSEVKGVGGDKFGRNSRKYKSMEGMKVKNGMQRKIRVP